MSSVNTSATGGIDKSSIYWDALEREETQKKTFCKWVQFQLSRHPSPKYKQAVTDLYYDLRDGHNLLDLLEVILPPDPAKSREADAEDVRGVTKTKRKSSSLNSGDRWKRELGDLRVHQLANAGTVLNILRDCQHPFSKCVNINSVDIVDGKYKLARIL